MRIHQTTHAQPGKTTMTTATDAPARNRQPTSTPFNTRAVTSFTMLLASLLIIASGVFLYISPRTWVADRLGWTMIGLDKWQWLAVHINVSVLFILAAVVHFYLNIKPFLNYIRHRKIRGLRYRHEAGVALLITAACVVGAYFDTLPFHYLDVGKEGIRDYWQQRAVLTQLSATPLSTPADIARRAGIDPDEVVRELRNAGLIVNGADQSLSQIAKKSQTDAAYVRDILSRSAILIRATRNTAETTAMSP